MAKDQEVLRLFGKLIGLPSASRPKSQLDENSYTSEGGLVLDPALMGEGLGNMSGMGGDVGGSSASSSKNMRCDYVHPISRERCPKGRSSSFPCSSRSRSPKPRALVVVVARSLTSSCLVPFPLPLQSSRGCSTCDDTSRLSTTPKSPRDTSARTARRGSLEAMLSLE